MMRWQRNHESDRCTQVDFMTRTVQWCSLLLFGHLLCSCDSPPVAKPLQVPPSVTVSRPLQKNITEWDEYTGRFVAVDTVEVRARVSGFINSIHFKDGRIVKQGDLLFVIDPRPYRIAVVKAKDEVERTRCGRQIAVTDVG